MPSVHPLTSLPLLLCLVFTAVACDETEEGPEDDTIDLCDVFCPKDSDTEEPPEDDGETWAPCDFLGCRVTAAEVGSTLGLSEEEAATLLDEVGYQPEHIGGELRYLLGDDDLTDLASRS